MTPEVVAALYDRVVPGRRDAPVRGGEHHCRCPLHGDEHPSLRIRVDGLPWYCGPCGRGGGAIDLAHLVLGRDATAELLREMSPRSNGRPRSEGAATPRRVTEYLYTDRMGEPLRRKARWEPGFDGRSKSFTWEKRDGRGGWLKCERDGNPGVLYRLSEVVEADEAHLHEGEKAADRAALASPEGVAHTCLPAGDSLTPEMLDVLRGKKITIWADRDEAGRAKAAKRYRQLVGVAASVVVVQAAVEREGADAFDHFEGGHAIDAAIPIAPADLGPDHRPVVNSERPRHDRDAPNGGGRESERASHPSPAGDGSKAAKDPSRFFSDSGLIVPLLGDAVRERGEIRVGIDGRLYRYAGGVFRGDGEAFARATVRQLLGERFRRRHQDEALAYLRAEFASITDRQLDGLINLPNGLLEWGGSTPCLHAHTPEIRSTIQLPVRWNPAARCPRFEAFLVEVAPDAVELVYEIIGYSLLSQNPLRVAVLLLGPGCNGKTVLLLVIKALLGSENVSAIPLQLLSEHRFAAAELLGKLANICGDLDARAVRHTDMFKMLTGGDPMMAERKHREPFTFTPFALPIFSANEPPLSSDQTDAWFDRWIVIPMERRIAEEQVDSHLAAKLTTESELEGLLVRAVEGLRRLMARGRFELPPAVQAARGQYRERLDTVRGFVAEECELALFAWTLRTALYRAYRTWAQDGGRLPVSAVTFYDHLRRNHPGQVEERTRQGSRGFAGIALRGAP